LIIVIHLYLDDKVLNGLSVADVRRNPSISEFTFNPSHFGLIARYVNYDKQMSQAAAGAGFSGDGGTFRSLCRRLSLQIPGQPGQGFAGGIEWSRDGEVEEAGSSSPTRRFGG
jgi:hypothetical protein